MNLALSMMSLYIYDLLVLIRLYLCNTDTEFWIADLSYEILKNFRSFRISKIFFWNELEITECKNIVL